jgi:hypothetical protein
MQWFAPWKLHSEYMSEYIQLTVRLIRQLDKPIGVVALPVLRTLPIAWCSTMHLICNFVQIHLEHILEGYQDCTYCQAGSTHSKMLFAEPQTRRERLQNLPPVEDL